MQIRFGLAPGLELDELELWSSSAPAGCSLAAARSSTLVTPGGTAVTTQPR